MNWMFKVIDQGVLKCFLSLSFCVQQGKKRSMWRWLDLSILDISLKHIESLFSVTFCLDWCSSMYYLLVCLNLGSRQSIAVNLLTFNKTHISLNVIPESKNTFMCLCFKQRLNERLEKCFCLAGCVWLCCKFAFKCLEIKQNQTHHIVCTELCLSQVMLTVTHSSCYSPWTLSLVKYIKFVYSSLTHQLFCFNYWWPVTKFSTCF